MNSILSVARLKHPRASREVPIEIDSGRLNFHTVAAAVLNAHFVILK
jgi:hypothetical protein